MVGTCSTPTLAWFVICYLLLCNGIRHNSNYFVGIGGLSMIDAVQILFVAFNM